MKAYFDRNEEFFITEEGGFFANAVEVPAEVVTSMKRFADLLREMQSIIDTNGAAEHTAQEEADFFVAGVQKIFKKRSS